MMLSSSQVSRAAPLSSEILNTCTRRAWYSTTPSIASTGTLMRFPHRLRRLRRIKIQSWGMTWISKSINSFQTPALMSQSWPGTRKKWNHNAGTSTLLNLTTTILTKSRRLNCNTRASKMSIWRSHSPWSTSKAKWSLHHQAMTLPLKSDIALCALPAKKISKRRSRSRSTESKSTKSNRWVKNERLGMTCRKCPLARNHRRHLIGLISLVIKSRSASLWATSLKESCVRLKARKSKVWIKKPSASAKWTVKYRPSVSYNEKDQTSINFSHI